MKFAYIPSDLTVYKSIKKLKPGYIAEFSLEKDLEMTSPRVYKWWDYEEVINASKLKEYNSKEEALLILKKP